MANNFEHNLYANAFLPDATNGPAQVTTGTVDRQYLAFDDTTTETARSFAFQMPAAYTGSGTLKADVWYRMASATSGTVEFELSVEAISDGDSIDMDTTESFDSVNNASETVPGTAKYPSKVTATLTNKDSVAAGDSVRIKIARDADDGTNDTATGDARVWLVVIREEA